MMGFNATDHLKRSFAALVVAIGIAVLSRFYNHPEGVIVNRYMPHAAYCMAMIFAIMGTGLYGLYHLYRYYRVTRNLERF